MASKNHKLWYQSSYDRGLDILLYLWPDIRQAYPDAELGISYGFDLFLKVASGNPERMQWFKSMETLLKQPGITHYGRIGQDQLKSIRKDYGILAYPTYFQEISCIGALESQASGLVPVTMALGALQETAKEGILVKGDIKDVKVQQEYLKQLLDLMGDKEKWNKMSLKCKKFTNKYHWDTISSKWAEYFDEPVSKPLVTIYTPSIREGWWRIMSENIAKQSYSNIEWVIVDDYPEDRSDIAKKYADNYNLNIHYLRGDKGTGRNSYSRRCGLVRANNLAWKAMKGELLVFLQDFILMPQNGIEQLVDIYRHNPDALIAPTDVRYLCSEPDRTNKEDWWNGKTDVLTTLDWTNARNLNLGMRESENPFEFETNYAAMPKKILDELNGFWEFFDDGLGYDNTEICLRAFKLGYRLIVDDTNVCKAINLWTYIKGEAQNVSGRERILNTPRWQWFINSELPPVRDEKVDASINLKFEVPREIEDKDCATWINGNAERISKEWK